MERPQQDPQPRLYDKRRKGWFWNENALIDEFAPYIGPNGIAVYNVISRHADEKGVGFPPIGYIAERLGLSESTVKRTLRNLAKQKILTPIARYRDDGSQLPNDYQLNELTGRSPVTEGASPENGEGVTDDRGEGVTDDLHKKTQSQENQGKNSSSTSVEEAPAQLFEPEPQEEDADPEPEDEAYDDHSDPDEFVDYIARELDGAEVPLTHKRKSRYGREFKEAIAKDADEVILWKAAKWIVARWLRDDHYKLLVEQAVGDVLNGKTHAKGERSSGAKAQQDSGESNVSSITPGAGVATPPAGIAAIEASNDLKRYAQYAYKHDFSANGGDERPPWPVFANLGGDDDEREANLRRIRSVVRRGINEAEQGDNLRPVMHYYQAHLHLALEPTTIGEVLHKAETEGWGHQQVMAYIEETYGG